MTDTEKIGNKELEVDNRPYGANNTRTCVACGTKGDKAEFLRYVLSPDGVLVCDVRQKIQSRGVYVCANKTCMTKAIKKNCFSRFLRTDVSTTLEDAATSTANGLDSYIFSLLKMAYKSGKLACGHTSVFHMVGKGKVKLLLLATDAGGSIQSKVEHLSEKHEIEIIALGTKQEIAEKLGIEEKAVIAICAGGFASSVSKSWRMYKEVTVW